VIHGIRLYSGAQERGVLLRSLEEPP